MHREKMLAVAEAHIKMLTLRGIPAIKYHYNATLDNQISTLRHCHFMLKKIPGMCENNIGLAARWLDFIQGALCACGVYTIEEIRELNA